MSNLKQIIGLIIVLAFIIPIIGWLFFMLGYAKNWTDYAGLIVVFILICIAVYFVNKKFR